MLNMHRVAFAQAPSPMLLLDAAGRVLDVNRAAQSLLGDGLGEADRARLHAARVTGAARRVHVGARGGLDVDVIPLDEAGGSLCVFLTSRSPLAVDEALLRRFHESPLPMMLSDYRDGRYVDVNDAYVRLSGRSRETLLGHTTLELGLWRCPEDRTRLFEHFAKLERVVDFEFDLVRGDGSIRNVRCWFERVVRDGRRSCSRSSMT